jgi:hypothetical protein
MRAGAAALLIFLVASTRVDASGTSGAMVMGSEREPEQFENPTADLLLRVAESLRVRDHQLVSVPRGDALKTVPHEERNQHFG